MVIALVATGCSDGGPAPDATILPSFSGAVNVVSVNTGGPTLGEYRADEFFYHGASYGTDVPIDMSGVPDDPPPQAVFNTERFGVMTYTIPDREGPQSVTLYFTESWVTGPGERVFIVSINGKPVLEDFDILAESGGQNRAIARSFGAEADDDGNIVIDFTAKTQEPKINGIRVVGEGSTPSSTAIEKNDRPPVPPPATSADAVASAGCGAERTLRDGTVTVESGGEQRSYILRVPETYDNTHPYRLVLAYHWRGGTATAVAEGIGATESPFYGLWYEADSSTIFVAPVGHGTGTDTGWQNLGGVDVDFTDAILAQVEADLCIDTTRVFAVGFSYGAGMSYALACARPDVFRGVALFSGGELSGCEGGAVPVAFYASHGVVDNTVDIAWGRAVRNHFAVVNGTDLLDPPEPEVGSGEHICTVYSGGSPDYPVEWCAFDGDHTPNPHDAGEGNSWAPAEVWAFISQF